MVVTRQGSPVDQDIGVVKNRNDTNCSMDRIVPLTVPLTVPLKENR